MNFILLPAVDVSEGKAIRLTQGKAGTEQSYGTPLDAALAWQNAGASWVHLVDIDAAFGRGNNREILAEVIASLTIYVELSGGIRDDLSLKAALATGCARVNLGTAAVENPIWCGQIIAEYGSQIAVGLDVEKVDVEKVDPENPQTGQWRVKGRGWVSDSGELWEVLDRLNNQGCQRYIVTDVSRDGMLSGPNIDLLTEVLSRTDAQIIASGGVASLDDLSALASVRVGNRGLEGAIIGKALYAQKFTLEQALKITR